MATTLCTSSAALLLDPSIVLSQLAIRSTGLKQTWPRRSRSSNSWQLLQHSEDSRRSWICQASEKEKVGQARKMQLQATELLAELLKSDNPKHTAQQHLDSLNQEFFVVGSTYLSMAKKEGNAEVVNQLEAVLKVAMAEKEKSLRPEIQLLNQLLRDTGPSKRSKTMENYLSYLRSDSYFFQLLNRMIMDVERQQNNAQKLKLLSQLRTILKETKEMSKGLKHERK